VRLLFPVKFRVALSKKEFSKYRILKKSPKFAFSKGEK
jgi:hypothetical protein